MLTNIKTGKKVEMPSGARLEFPSSRVSNLLPQTPVAQNLFHLYVESGHTVVDAAIRVLELLVVTHEEEVLMRERLKIGRDEWEY